MAPVQIVLVAIMPPIVMFFFLIYKRPPAKSSFTRRDIKNCSNVKHVAFYRSLDEAGKSRFEEKDKKNY